MSSGSLQTLERGLDILLLCAKDESSSCSLEEIMQDLNVPRSTAYRMVKSLLDRGFLRKGAKTGQYQLGYQLVQLAQLADTRAELAQAAIPVLEEIVKEFGETSFITVRSGWQALCLEQVESPHPIRLSYSKGRTLPLYAGGSAKVILAHLSQRDQEKILSRDLNTFTDPALVDPDIIRLNLDDIKKKGYAVSRGETDLGAVAICVPILDSEGKLLGGLTVAGPAGRMPDDDDVSKFVQFMKPAAKRIAIKYNDLCGW